MGKEYIFLATPRLEGFPHVLHTLGSEWEGSKLCDQIFVMAVRSQKVEISTEARFKERTVLDTIFNIIDIGLYSNQRYNPYKYSHEEN